MIFIKNFILIFILIIGLSDCSSSGSIKADIKIKSATYLNPDVNGKAAPVEVSIYQLKSPYPFNQAGFYALETDAAAVLQNSLIDKNVLEIRPNQHRSYSLQLPSSVHYLGVVTAFRNIDHATWRVLLAVPKIKTRWWHIHDVTVLLNLFSQALVAHIN